ncbi:hypothetical protein ACJRO7_020419 [Eucalyptus globulus]|uniref:FLZ-type domain-containing protein n=1 Tax=Eucalyptus globulus TaxID=34317 RepID=A0ABD3KL30_EUCGL
MAASLTAAILYCAGCKGRHYEPHFLQSCFLCYKSLGFNSDIFLYREKAGRGHPSSRSSSPSFLSRKSESSKRSKAVRSGTVAVA